MLKEIKVGMRIKGFTTTGKEYYGAIVKTINGKNADIQRKQDGDSFWHITKRPNGYWGSDGPEGFIKSAIVDNWKERLGR